jgi:hypothetical protein
MTNMAEERSLNAGKWMVKGEIWKSGNCEWNCKQGVDTSTQWAKGEWWARIKLSLCLIKHYAIKTTGEMEVRGRPFFNLNTRWRCVLWFSPRQLYSRGKTSGSCWVGSRVGRTLWRGEKFLLLLGIKPRSPVVQPIAQSLMWLSYRVIGSTENCGRAAGSQRCDMQHSK